MTKSVSTTTEQLRRLMKNHVGNTTPPPAVVAPTVETVAPISLPPPVSAATVVAAPSIEKVTTRYSLRLLASEIAKVNSIVQNTLEKTGERITLTDVLRVGLCRINDSSAIAKTELMALRRYDGRRHKG